MTHTNEKGHGCDPVPFQKHTSNIRDFATTGNQGKALANQIARQALAGHVVHTRQRGDFTVCPSGMPRYCKDFKEWQTFTRQLRRLMRDPSEQFSTAIAAAGLTPPDEIIDDGKIHRFSSNGKPRDEAGWYVLHPDGVPAGSFGCWREGFTQTWCAMSTADMTQQERDDHKLRINAMQAQRDADKELKHHNARISATAMWTQAAPALVHAYLTRKGIQAYGARVLADKLLIPMRDTSRTLHSLQTITVDGDKRFHWGGQVTGCYHAIGKPDGVLIICEGFATGASIRQATGDAVAICFTAGNVKAVAISLHRKYPELTLIVAADDDHMTAGNPGLTAAREAALAVGGFAVVPQFPAGRPAKATDFNDLAVIAGHHAVNACFSEIKGFVC